jgi:hypothetical protein
VETALDPELMPHVGQERPVLYAEVESLALAAAEAGTPRLPCDELWRRAAPFVTEEQSFADALWFWHEAGSLIHYRDVPQLAEQVFVDPSWVLKLISTLVEQKHTRGHPENTPGRLPDDTPGLQQLLRTGLLNQGLLRQLWHEMAPPVAAAAEPVLLELLMQFDLLVPGPRPQTFWLTLLLPRTLDAASQGEVDTRWPAESERAQAGARFTFLQQLPPGLVERLLARCAKVEGCAVDIICWGDGMLATGASAGCQLRIQRGKVPLCAGGPMLDFVDVEVRMPEGDGKGACRAAAPFVAAAEALMGERFDGVAARRQHHVQGQPVEAGVWAALLSDALGVVPPPPAAPPAVPAPPPSCSVCFGDEPLGIIAPCGHKTVCQGCFAILQARGDPCPLCRRDMDGFVAQVFA